MAQRRRHWVVPDGASMAHRGAMAVSKPPARVRQPHHSLGHNRLDAGVGHHGGIERGQPAASSLSNVGGAAPNTQLTPPAG